MSKKEIVTVEYDNGTYTGEVLDGLPHGEGKMICKDGSVYEGEWKNGSLHGHGRAKCYEEKGMLSSGPWYDYAGTFEGEFENGDFKHGKWSERNANYEGDFVDGLYDGYGVKKWNCGVHYYKGQWKEGLYHGTGILSEYDGIWEGQFVNGHINGKGTFTSKQGWVFTGTAIEHWEIEGTGRITFSNGDVYVGEVGSSYKSMGNLSMHGEGTYTYKGGSVYKGEFVYGRRKADIDAEKKAKQEEERRQEEARLEAERREAEERAKDPVAYDAAKKKAYREQLEEKCKVLYGSETDIGKRLSILKEAFFQAHNSGFNDHMAWELAAGKEDSGTSFWQEACRLKYEVEALCKIYEKELGDKED